MDNCIFCKIVQKQIPASIVYEDDVSIAFLDINPVHEGHTLLIPKEHHENMVKTPDTLIESLFVRAKKLMPAIQNATAADFIVLTIVGIDVPHFHIHLIPRYHNDGLSGFWPTKKYENSEKQEEVARSIKNEVH